MKSLFYLIIFLIPMLLIAQDYEQESINYQTALNADYKSGKDSPLSPRDKDMFHALNFYFYNPELVVEARFEKATKKEKLVFKTSTSRTPTYERYGTLYFMIDGKECQLTVFEDPSLKNHPEYYNHLFVPFTDLTNGNGSYEVGRYLDLESPLEEKIMLNFNNTYNPYCAYSKRYSCPVPPVENHLNVKIEAGVKVGFK